MIPVGGTPRSVWNALMAAIVASEKRPSIGPW
jgi:hypothetical protein